MKNKKGVAESHLMIEIAGLLILAMTAVLIYFVVKHGTSALKDVICSNITNVEGTVGKLIGSLFGFC